MMSVNANADQNNKSYLKVVRIYSAIKEHMHEIDIEKILQTEGHINYRTTEGVPNLLYEVTKYYRNNDLMKLLLNYGVDFTLKYEQGQTVVHRAIHDPHFEYHNLLFRREFQDKYIDLILAAHVQFENPSNPCDAYGISHFHAACMTNNAEAVEFFLRNGVDVNQAVNADSPIFPSYTALELAVKYTSPDAVKLLLKHGANVRTKNIDGLGPLHSIVQRKISKFELIDEPRFVRTFNILIKFAYDNDMDNDEFGFCKLHIACLLGDEILVENILVTNFNRRVNSDSPICPGYGALHFAAFSNVQIFKLLLKNGANIDYKNEKGQTPFDLCLQNYTATDIHSIISSKKEWADITLSDNETKLLTVILAMEHIDEFRSFLDLPRHFKFTNRYIPFNSPLWPGYTLLHLAVIFAKKILDTKVTYFAQKDDINFIEVLLKREGGVTVADAEGSTALHLAFYMQKRNVVRCLLKYHYNSNLNPIDKNNMSHSHIAYALEQPIECCLSNHENVNAPVNSKFDWHISLHYLYNQEDTRHFSICPGSTALHIAVVFGNNFGNLMKHGADVYAQDANGFTPVHRLLTCRDKQEVWSVAKFLLKVGSSRNVTTNCGLSHLHVACYFVDLEAVEKLLKAGADSKLPVNCTFDSRMNDYDDVFCALDGNHYESWSFLAEYSNYTPLEFLWHPHRHREEYDNEIFWKISFMLIKRDADVFAKNSKGISMLRSLLRKIETQKCSCLYAMLNKSNPTLVRLEEEFGVTKLHLACFLSDAKVVENLLKRGATVNAKVHCNSPVWQGCTPLHFAVKRTVGYIHTKEILDPVIKNIRLLMKYGADPLLVDCNNESPFHEIKRYESSDRHDFARSALVANLFECIVNYNVNSTDNQGFSIFHIACMAHNEIAVKGFLTSGVDVNQSVSGFSNYLPGKTSLHLLIQHHRDWSHSPCTDACENENFLRILMMLLEYGADVDAKDAAGKTPLLEALRLSSSRRTVSEILIRKGADVHTTIMPSNDTPFELLLRLGDASREEIELFLKTGCKFNAFNPATKEGYMAQVFRYQHRDTFATNDIMESQVLNRILNDPKIAEIDDAGRTAIHNVVSINYFKISDDECINRAKYRSQKFRFWLTPKQKAIRRAQPIYKPTTYKEFYPDLIELLCIRDCDIDHEDNEGKTALHLAVAFKNNRAIVPLLKMGADINITDKNGKTAFAYCTDVSTTNYDSWNDFGGALVYEDVNYLNKVLTVHVYKLEFCGQRVDKQNRILRGKKLSILSPIPWKFLNGFHDEMEATKNMKIGATSFSVYDFLTSTDTDFLYMNMNSEERLEIDQFFQNVRQHNFVEIDGLLRLKYRQSIERKKLIEPALESLNLLSKLEIPDLCGRYILKFLKNEDLKRLISSVA